MDERDVILEVKHLKQYFKINHKFTVKVWMIFRLRFTAGRHMDW